MEKKSVWQTFKKGVVTGLGWTFGATIGFTIISGVLIILLRQLGGLPLVGDFLAAIVDATQESLLKRTPIIPQ